MKTDHLVLRNAASNTSRKVLMLSICLICFSLETVVAKPWLFVADMVDRQIVAYARNPMTGELTRRAATKTSAEPGVMCVSPDRKILFVAMRSSGELASYRMEEDGQLELINSVKGGADPCYLFTDNNGRFLLTAYYVANQVTVHSIAKDGTLGSKPLQVVPTAKNAHAIHLDQRNEIALVPHTGGNQIFLFRFDKQTGKLTPAAPKSIQLSDGDEPRHVAMHPNGKWAYSNNEAGDSINALVIDREKVSLRRTQKLTTLPDGFDAAQNTTARCEMTADSKFVYVANRGSNSIAAFAIDSSDGRLEPRGVFPTERTPRSLSIDSKSRFLYAAGQDNGKLAVYRIQDDGSLKRKLTYDIGSKPWCVLAFDTDTQAAVDPDIKSKAAKSKITRDIEYAKVGKHSLLLDIYRPTKNSHAREKSPLVVWVHGGAWRAGSKNKMPLGWLVDDGYTVASIDYRLSPVARFPAQIHDCKAAIRFLRAKAEKYGYDARRIAIAGSSAGGHLVALVGVSNDHEELEGTVGDHLEESSNVDAIVDYYGPTNFMTILKQSTPHGLSVRVPALQLLLGDRPENVAELAKLASPVFHVDKRDPPLLLIHGDQDPQVPVNQSLELQSAYERVGGEVQLEVVSGGEHGGPQFFDERRRELVSRFLSKNIRQ